MYAVVKIVDTDQPIVVKNLRSITVIDDEGDEETYVDDMESLILNEDFQYVFKGDSIMHALGVDIQFIQIFPLGFN